MLQTKKEIPEEDLNDITFDMDRLRAKRKAQGRTATQVARVIGIRPGQLSNIERGHAGPSAKVLLRLILLYGVEPAEIAIRESELLTKKNLE